MHHGVYISTARARAKDADAAAWMAALPDAAAMYGRTAASWYELPIDPGPDFQVIVPVGTVPRRRSGLEPHEGLRRHEAVVHRGLRVTTPERTWLDLSLTLPDVQLVIVGDAMLRRGLTTPSKLIDAADGWPRRRGIVRARELAREVRERVDSPQETRTRLVLVAGGLPVPFVNPDVLDDHGQWIGRPDLAYVHLKIGIQYEGDMHRTDRRRWMADIARDEVMRDHGWEVIRVTARDLSRPWHLQQRVLRAMDRQRERFGQA